jgi:hypothetical protein
VDHGEWPYFQNLTEFSVKSSLSDEPAKFLPLSAVAPRCNAATSWANFGDALLRSRRTLLDVRRNTGRADGVELA